MSEIKGQILGIILVLTIFVATSATLTLAFRNVANTASSEIGETAVVQRVFND